VVVENYGHVETAKGASATSSMGIADAYPTTLFNAPAVVESGDPHAIVTVAVPATSTVTTTVDGLGSFTLSKSALSKRCERPTGVGSG